MSIDKKRFAEALKEIGQNQGRRCVDMRNHPDAPGRNRKDVGPDVESAAIAMTVLIGLRELAEWKVLSRHDIQAVIDSFYAAADIEEYEGIMGGVLFRRAPVKETANG